VASPAEHPVLHLYGVVSQEPAGPLPPGVGGAPVAVDQVAGLSVLVSALDVERYGPEVWRDRGQDPAWLTQVATEHHAVLQAVVEQGDVLPLRLPSLYMGRSAVERALSADADALSSGLAAVRGHVEVVVKVFLADTAPDAADAAGGQSAPTSGRDYLARKAAQKSSQEEARERRRQAVLALHEALAGGSTHSVVSPAQDPSLSGRAEPMLLNAAYLVARGELESFHGIAEGLAERLGQQSLLVELSGPWPPYSFTSLTRSRQPEGT
jgi:hypothetical protein